MKFNEEQEREKARRELAELARVQLRDLDIADVPHAMLLLRSLDSDQTGAVVPTNQLVANARKLGRMPPTYAVRIQFLRSLNRLRREGYVVCHGPRGSRMWEPTQRGWNVVQNGSWKTIRTIRAS